MVAVGETIGDKGYDMSVFSDKLMGEDFKEMKTGAARGVKVAFDGDVTTEHGKAFVDKLTPAMKVTMRYEGLMPFEYAPEKGLVPPKTIPVRPGETASLSLEIYGPATKPTFIFKGSFGSKETVCAFDAEIGVGERLICRDGRTWRIEMLKDGRTVKEGELTTPLPTLGGTTTFDFSATLKDGASCVVDILKEYLEQ